MNGIAVQSTTPTFPSPDCPSNPGPHFMPGIRHSKPPGVFVSLTHLSIIVRVAAGERGRGWKGRMARAPHGHGGGKWLEVKRQGCQVWGTRRREKKGESLWKVKTYWLNLRHTIGTSMKKIKIKIANEAGRGKIVEKDKGRAWACSCNDFCWHACFHL